jgi:hypothetical protein
MKEAKIIKICSSPDGEIFYQLIKRDSKELPWYPLDREGEYTSNDPEKLRTIAKNEGYRIIWDESVG